MGGSNSEGAVHIKRRNPWKQQYSNQFLVSGDNDEFLESLNAGKEKAVQIQKWAQALNSVTHQFIIVKTTNYYISYEWVGKSRVYSFRTKMISEILKYRRELELVEEHNFNHSNLHTVTIGEQQSYKWAEKHSYNILTKNCRDFASDIWNIMKNF